MLCLVYLFFCNNIMVYNFLGKEVLKVVLNKLNQTILMVKIRQMAAIFTRIKQVLLNKAAKWCYYAR